MENGPGWKMYFLLQIGIFHCHVSLLEGSMNPLVPQFLTTLTWYGKQLEAVRRPLAQMILKVLPLGFNVALLT